MTDENRELEEQMLADAQARSATEPLWNEPFLLPSEGWHSSAFGSARRYYPDGPVSHHEGTDLASMTGTPIYATNRGTVLVAGYYPLKGGLVVLDHGAGLMSLYLHQSEIHVTAGQQVERGELLGEVGSTGISTGPHLHWEMRVNLQPTDPLLWVDRLLPGDHSEE
jgi:murein DD-endopeptidase MepM/ murein hydrolase activator NlpD